MASVYGEVLARSGCTREASLSTQWIGFTVSVIVRWNQCDKIIRRMLHEITVCKELMRGFYLADNRRQKHKIKASDVVMTRLTKIFLSSGSRVAPNRYGVDLRSWLGTKASTSALKVRLRLRTTWPPSKCCRDSGSGCAETMARQQEASASESVYLQWQTGVDCALESGVELSSFKRGVRWNHDDKRWLRSKLTP